MMTATGTNITPDKAYPRMASEAFGDITFSCGATQMPSTFKGLKLIRAVSVIGSADLQSPAGA